MFTSDCQSKGAFRRQNSADGDFFLIKINEAVNPHIDFLSLRRSDNAQKRPCGFYSARSFSCYGLKIGVAQNQTLIICSSLRLQPEQQQDERSEHGTVSKIHSRGQSCGRTQQKTGRRRAHHRYRSEVTDG